VAGVPRIMILLRIELLSSSQCKLAGGVMTKRERDSMNRISPFNEPTSSADPTAYVLQLNTRRFNSFLYLFQLTIPPTPSPHSAPDILYESGLH
jgi:hypothetical protein